MVYTFKLSPNTTTMKISSLLIFIGILLLQSVTGLVKAQNFGINATGAAPNPKALLDIDATGMATKGGLLVPRLTTADRNAITGPIPESLLIYNTNTQCFEAWNQTIGTWVAFGCIGCAVPLTPGALAATNTTTNSLSANWMAVSGATAYVLDVSTSPTFATFVSGYNNLNSGNSTTATVSSLTCATTYYYRVRAANACGTSASSATITVTTPTCAVTTATAPSSVTCGTLVWAAANLNVGAMVAGGATQTNNGTVEKYCYNNLPANCSTYGGLYQWDEAMAYNPGVNCDPCGTGGQQGICPAGFHIPSDWEWSHHEFCVESTIAPVGATSLTTFQTGIFSRGTNVGYKLKATAANTPPWDGTNASGFNALPSGSSSGSVFLDLGNGATYWSSTDFDAVSAYNRTLVQGFGSVDRYNYQKTYGYSVRCLQN
jgi:uncharacterized protein (TIGR02145 family)